MPKMHTQFGLSILNSMHIKHIISPYIITLVMNARLELLSIIFNILYIHYSYFLINTFNKLLRHFTLYFQLLFMNLLWAIYPEIPLYVCVCVGHGKNF